VKKEDEENENIFGDGKKGVNLIVKKNLNRKHQLTISKG